MINIGIGVKSIPAEWGQCLLGNGVREQPHLGKQPPAVFEEKKNIVLVSVQCVKEVEEGAEDAALGCPDVERQTDEEV